MMILKTNRRSYRFWLATFIIFFSGPSGHAYTEFECLRDLMPITDRANFQTKRVDVEEPFLVGDNWIIFPEVINQVVAGFFFYGLNSAKYYDAVERPPGKIKHIGDLKYVAREGLYELVAQPDGLETVAIRYLPGFQVESAGRNGPVMLGASVLPVVGAFVSRPELIKTSYHNPTAVNENDLKEWMASRMARRPASLDDVKIEKSILRLKTVEKKSADQLWRPIRAELKLRRKWIQSHNLDDKSFKELSLTMASSCKE
ncbi:MAG: hypothetical protein AB7F86_03630 [Bdellovibrionales bacterium]